MADENTSLDEIVLQYRKVRDTIRDKEAVFNEEVAELKEELDGLSALLLKACKDNSADSIRTAAGTITRRVNTRYWTSDWESMYEFIREHNVPFLLEQRLHNGNMKQFLEENKDLLPVGLQADRKFVIQVRKPTSK
jgi:hypothetical protein